MRKIAGALAAAAALTFAFTIPSHASGTVNVQLALGAATTPVTGAACTLQVPAGANGLTVLDAAVAKKCIASYKASDFGFGHFVECINEVCGAPAEAMYATYWSMYENGAVTWDYGVDGFSAQEGDVLGFSYVSWLVPA